jgi:hypothetical protein
MAEEIQTLEEIVEGNRNMMPKYEKRKMGQAPSKTLSHYDAGGTTKQIF